MYEPDFEEWLGAKVISVEPRRSPDTAAPLIAADALTAERCCGSRPGFRRPARMFTRRMCRAVMIERLRAVRRIWPPPSPCEPSSVRTLHLYLPHGIGAFNDAMNDLNHGKLHSRGICLSAVDGGHPPLALSRRVREIGLNTLFATAVWLWSSFFHLSDFAFARGFCPSQAAIQRLRAFRVVHRKA